MASSRTSITQGAGCGIRRTPNRETGSQVVGLVMARVVVGVEPLASLEPGALARAIAPTFQRYLAEPL
jgi:hypothetical protein